MSWKTNAKTHRGAQKRRKSAQIRVKSRLNDTVFQRNINSINQLQRNAQYHPPFLLPASFDGHPRFLAQWRTICCSADPLKSVIWTI